MFIGKSSSGKDTIYKKVLRKVDADAIVTHTTRRMRSGEIDGETYHFDTYEQYKEYSDQNMLVGSTKFTIFEPGNQYDAYYYTVKSDLSVGSKPKIVIGNPRLYSEYVKSLGNDKVYPIRIEIDDGTRMERALAREKQQIKPNYLEMCKRFIKDDSDFSPENLKSYGIDKFPIFVNDDLDACVDRVSIYINAISKSFGD